MIKFIILAVFICQCSAKAINDAEISTTGSRDATFIEGSDKHVCYKDVGCFDIDPPFDNSRETLPASPFVINTEYILFTPQQPMQGEVVSWSDISRIKDTRYNRDLPLVFIIHGFDNNRHIKWINTMKDALLKKDRLNVIVVDWGIGAAAPNYYNATANTRIVGRQVGLLKKEIEKQFYAENPASLHVHCIGHSLGAHTCGYASNFCNNDFDRISGMDPAGPNFEETDIHVRLDPSDAKFVDAIHTNGDRVITGSFGIIQPVGHVDFYPNGGRAQPGCPNLIGTIGGIFSNASAAIDGAGCSHARAYHYFTESINSHCMFTAFPCVDYATFEQGGCTSCGSRGCSRMGYYADQSRARGSVYLATQGVQNKDYCGYHYLVEVHVSAKSDKSAGEMTLTLVKANVTYQLASTNTEFPAGLVIKKMIAIGADLASADEQFALVFKKKANLIIWQPDPNASKILIEKIKVGNIEIGEMSSHCDEISLESNKQFQFSLKDNDCPPKGFLNKLLLG